MEIPPILTAEKSNLGIPFGAEPSLPVNPVKVGTAPAGLLVVKDGGFEVLVETGRGGGVFPGRRPVK